MKEVFGPSFLIVIAILVTTSISSCVDRNASRYQIITAGGIKELMDMKTMDVYYSNDAKWHRITPQGVETVVSELPQ